MPLSVIRSCLLFSGLMLVSACTNLSELKEINPGANDFASALAAEYLAYAESEKERGRFLNANYYAGKGLKAVNRKDVEPDALDTSLPEDVQEELQAARKDLATLLNEDVKRAKPQELARLQLLFDCWQQQAARRDIRETSCSEEFKPAVIELQGASRQVVYNEIREYLLSFRYNSDKLTTDSAKAFNAMMREVAQLADFVIVLQAGSTKGSKQRALQVRRLKAVHALLKKAGIPEKRIREYSEGDSKRVYLSEDKPSPVSSKRVLVVVKTPKQAER